MKSEYKLTVLGSGGVGKTAFTTQMCSSHFVEYYDPTIESSYRRQVVIDDDACVLDILDTAGQEEYSALRSQWIRSGEGFLILYSVVDRLTLVETRSFRRQILQVKDIDESHAPPIVLIGNKCDMEDRRQVTREEGETYAREWSCPFLEASAKTRANVEESFFLVVRLIRRQDAAACAGASGGGASDSDGGGGGGGKKNKPKKKKGGGGAGVSAR